MTYDAIVREIKDKIYHPVYILHGEEPFYIDQLMDLLEDTVLTETEKAFNQTVLYGRDSSVMQVMEAASRLPMMSNYQLVLLKEAQYMRKLEDLEKYVTHPVKSTVLVVAHKHKKLDKRKRFYKVAMKNAVILESKKLYENQVPAWIKSHIGSHGYSISEKATMLLTEYIGNDLSKIFNELEKLMLIKSKGTEINAGDIEKNVGISKDFNVFEMQNAIGKRDTGKVYKILKYMSLNPRSNPFVVTLGALNQYFIKLYLYHHSKGISENDLASKMRIHPRYLYEIKEAGRNFNVPKLEMIFDLLQEYDLKSKGVLNSSTDDDELLKEMVFKILN